MADLVPDTGREHLLLMAELPRVPAAALTETDLRDALATAERANLS